MLAEATEVNFESADIIFFCIPLHGLNNNGPSTMISGGFSFNFWPLDAGIPYF